MTRTGSRRITPELGHPERVVSTVFGCRPEDVATDVVVTPFVPLKAFRDHMGEAPMDLAPPFFYKGITGEFRGRRLSVVLTGVGPARVGDCLGFLSLTPARRVLFVGAVGGLGPEQAIGDCFLPTEAADGEGYTRYVELSFEELVAGAPRVPAPAGPSSRLENLLRAEGLTVRLGRVFTVGSITFESDENLHTLVRHGYHALEMELSAFYSAARHHGFEAAALTYVSDLPLASPLWHRKTLEEAAALRRAYRAMPRLALEYLSRGGAPGD